MGSEEGGREEGVEVSVDCVVWGMGVTGGEESMASFLGVVGGGREERKEDGGT